MANPVQIGQGGVIYTATTLAAALRARLGAPAEVYDATIAETHLEDARVESREEPAREKNPPWHLIVLGDDLGRKEAAIIMQRRLSEMTRN